MTADLRLGILIIFLLGLIVWARARTAEPFAVNESENALCKALMTEAECNGASTECVWCPSQAPMCVMQGCCTEPGKGGLYKTTAECTEESKNLRGAAVAAVAAGNGTAAAALQQRVRNQIDTNIASKANSVFLNKAPTTALKATVAVAPATTAANGNRLPLPASVAAVSRPAAAAAAPAPISRPTAAASANNLQARPVAAAASTPAASIQARPVAAATPAPTMLQSATNGNRGSSQAAAAAAGPSQAAAPSPTLSTSPMASAAGQLHAATGVGQQAPAAGSPSPVARGLRR